jgi:diketogulonate reductase-like aldo/keto reductase
MDHECRGEPLTRRTVLRLMAGVAAGGPAGAGVASILQRPIHSSGETIPAVGLGTWRTFDVGAAAAARAPLREVLQRFVELGGRVVDSSPMYGAAESVLGDLAADLAVTDTLFLATKVWTSGRDAGTAQMEQSLRRLRGQALPAWAAEIGCASWAQLLLKWILAHPAVTCVIPATSRPQHLVDNMTAGRGALPDAATRERIAAAVAAAG